MTNVRLRYQTIEFGKIDIHVCTLRNRQEYYDPKGIAEKLGIGSASWPIFGIIWPSSLVLAHHLSDYETGSKRILEIGCGTALSSLLLNKKGADITATDYHPESKKFLARNTQLNNDKPIAFIQTDWAAQDDSLGEFDIIIGSDILYEDEHIELVANFIHRHAKQTCEIVITDPGRGRKSKLATKMKTLGYSTSYIKPPHTDYLDSEYKGHILSFKR